LRRCPTRKTRKYGSKPIFEIGFLQLAANKDWRKAFLGEEWFWRFAFLFRCFFEWMVIFVKEVVLAIVGGAVEFLV
jgi:hypothetical protein